MAGEDCRRLWSYLVEGGPSKHHERTKAMMLADPSTWHALMTALTDITIAFLRLQVDEPFLGAAHVAREQPRVGDTVVAQKLELVGAEPPQFGHRHGQLGRRRGRAHGSRRHLRHRERALVVAADRIWRRAGLPARWRLLSLLARLLPLARLLKPRPSSTSS